MIRRIIPCCLVLAGLLGACSPQQGMYYWGDYESRLYSYYKDPQDLKPLAKNLESTIAAGEESQRVPPGLYAEYGYLMMVRKRHGEAITYFNKEKTAWPESTVLMDKMIGFANSGRQRTELEGERGPGS